MSSEVETFVETVDECMARLGAQLVQAWQRIQEALKPIWQSIQRAFLPRSRRVHNTRIQMVQAKRARLMLPPSGKYLGMSRRASYALAKAVMRTGAYE